MPGPAAALLADGRRLHLQHGPIDLIIEALGTEANIRRAYDQARDAFAPLLYDLVDELELLRAPVSKKPEGRVAQHMWQATTPYADEFITPMAAVAGSVADYILAAMLAGNDLDRAYVNNGGDIALHVTNATFRIGICDNPATGISGGTIEVGANDGIGGVATSGWRGRSFSFGIADAVTVLATNAAMADAAATMIANQVDLHGSSKITRQSAAEIQPDSDLGTRRVTTDVAPLTDSECRKALSAGREAASQYHAKALFYSAYLALNGHRIAMPLDGIHAKAIGEHGL